MAERSRGAEVLVYDGAVDDGAVDDGAVDDGAVDDGAVDDGAVDDGAVDDGAVDDGAVDDGECRPSLLGAPLGPVEAAALARGFSALADPVRLRLISMLASAPAGEVCVCELVGPVGKSQPTVSHHLKVLGEAGLVRGDRRGKWVWYSLDRVRLAALRAAIGA